MVGAVLPKIIERQECKQVLQRIGFSVDAAHVIVQVHGYDTSEKLLRLKPDGIDILMKTLHTPGGERADGTRYPGISVPHSTHWALISLCFILFHHFWCDLCPCLNMINQRAVFDMDLQRSRRRSMTMNSFGKTTQGGTLLILNHPWLTSGSISSPFYEPTRPPVPIFFVLILSSAYGAIPTRRWYKVALSFLSNSTASTMVGWMPSSLRRCTNYSPPSMQLTLPCVLPS